MKISITGNYKGQDLTKKVYNYIKENYKNLEIINITSTKEELNADHQSNVRKASLMLSHGEIDRLIVVCGSGVAVNCLVNRHNNNYCLLAYNELITENSRKFGNINSISFGERYVTEDLALKIVNKFLTTKYTLSK